MTAMAPEPTVEHKRRVRRIRLLLVLITAAVLVLLGGGTALTWPQQPPLGKGAELPLEETGNSWLTYAESERIEVPTGWDVEINKAMMDGDREAFLSFGSGEGRNALARWWDGTRAIGWDVGYAIVSGSGADQRLTLGVELAFSSHADVGSGNEDAGLILSQTFAYAMTSEGEEDDLIITGLTPEIPMPWDESEVYVAKRPHVVLYGRADEQALVDANADIAETSAVKALDALASIGGKAPVSGFVSAITDSDESFGRWQGDGLGGMDVAGFARPTTRPDFIFGGGAIPPNIATGFRTSGSLVAMGPKSAQQREATFVHEFAHVLQETAVPQSGMGAWDFAGSEGFARYIETVAGAADTYFTDPRVKEQINSFGTDIFSNDRLRSEDAWFAYEAAGSYYQFVADTGGSAWQLALDRDEGMFLDQRATRQGSQFSGENWLAWVSSQ